MDAFSKVNPKLQIAWDASSLKSLQFCPRHYQYQNLEGWQGDSVDLIYGRHIASGFELFQKERLNGASIEDALVKVVRWALEETYDDETGETWGGHYETMWKCEGTTPYKNAKGNRAKCPFAFERAWFPGDAPDICVECRSGIKTERRFISEHVKNRQSLIRALIWYGLDQPEDLNDGYRPYVFPNGQPAVELSGRMPFPRQSPFGETYLLTWNFDYIGQWGDELFITDNKTTSKTLNGQFFDAYAVDTQFDTYDMVGSIAFPDLNIRGTMVDAVQVTAGGVDFGRHPYYKDEHQREEHLKDLDIWIGLAEQFALADYWPMNKRNCWLCPFKQVCAKPPADREYALKGAFVKGERWNPLRQR